MSSKQPWQADMSFTLRVEQINKIASRLGSANPSGPDSDARRRAAEIEKEIFNSASSKEEYESLCVGSVENREAQQPRHERHSSSSERPLSPSAVTIGKYVNAKHYRDGLFSFVYKAHALEDPLTEHSQSPAQSTFVALKVTTPSMMVEPHDSQREARILRRAVHENIITLHDSFRIQGGRLVLVFPFMPLDFETVLREKRLDNETAKSHLKDLFQALNFLRSVNIIHRDIKPSNLLLKGPSGPAYLADFGIAWLEDDPSSEPKDQKITDVGTTCYRPPELLFGNTAYGSSLDLWAAGCVVAEASIPSHHALFDAGDLGSELALIQSMFKNLGTPTLESWPEAANFRDWGKMAFHEYPAKSWVELLPGASHNAQDLVSKLVRFESGRRLSASEVLEHPFFNS